MKLQLFCKVALQPPLVYERLRLQPRLCQPLARHRSSSWLRPALESSRSPPLCGSSAPFLPQAVSAPPPSAGNISLVDCCRTRPTPPPAIRAVPADAALDTARLLRHAAPLRFSRGCTLRCRSRASRRGLESSGSACPACRAAGRSLAFAGSWHNGPAHKNLRGV